MGPSRRQLPGGGSLRRTGENGPPGPRGQGGGTRRPLRLSGIGARGVRHWRRPPSTSTASWRRWCKLAAATHIRIESVENSLDDPSLAPAAALALSWTDAMGLLTRDVTRPDAAAMRDAGQYAGCGDWEGDGGPPLSFLRCGTGRDRRLDLANRRDVVEVADSRTRVEGVEESVGDRLTGPVDRTVGGRRAHLSLQPPQKAGRSDYRTPPFPRVSRQRARGRLHRRRRPALVRPAVKRRSPTPTPTLSHEWRPDAEGPIRVRELAGALNVSPATRSRSGVAPAGFPFYRKRPSSAPDDGA